MKKAITKVEERHCVDKESFARRMEADWRERFEEEKSRTRAEVEKKTLLFEKEEDEEEEVKCKKEEKDGSVRETIPALMQQHGEEMRYYIEAASKEARKGGVTKVINAAAEEAIYKVRDKLELLRRRDVKEAVRVTEDDERRSRAQEEE